MNFKRNCKHIISLIAAALAVTGCSLNGTSQFSRYEYINEKEDKHETKEFEGYVQYGDYSNYIVNDSVSGEDIDLGSAYDIFKNYSHEGHIKSEGNQKLLVIPVDFPDYSVGNLSISKTKYIENLNKAFFGKQNNNAYVSVANYFNVSSYGKLKIDGKVCDKFYTFPTKVSDIVKNKVPRDDLVKVYYPKILEWYKKNYSDIDDYKIEGLEEGKNVPIYLVYTYPCDSQNESSTFFWAYTFSDVPLSWSSNSFMQLEYGEPDAHTYIHETGHLLGLTDYYPTITSDTKSPDPAGRIDMMDCSIGDETAYSKMFLNWTRPYVVNNNCQIKLNSFTESGDLVLLANDWNNTVFDEYYLVEFYSPTGLNTYDVSYGNSEAKLPAFPGIKIYHVDSRLAYISNDVNRTVLSYVGDPSYSPLSGNIISYAHDNNTYSKPNIYQANYLYELVLNHADYPIVGAASNLHLFRVGDEARGLPLNKGGLLNYSIKVDSISFANATITIEKIA